jgi:formate--tetrahydrofolate ligase
MADFPSDIEIAQKAELAPISTIGEKLGLQGDELIPYGTTKAKVSAKVQERLKDAENGKLVLVTALTATRAGDGKTVTSIGLAQGLAKLGVSHCLCLRQPSLGPTFGIKGGAAGGGYAQVLPMEDINMHLTGDFHAITYANNLLSAVIDNHIHFGNEMDIDPERVVWRRVIDLCDRQLRNCEIGRGGPKSGFPHETGFDITAASEVMAVLAMSKDRADLAERLGRMVVAYDKAGNPKYAKDFGCIGAMQVLMKDAMDPNLVQTIEHTPVLVHAGPFANIAHGCNSIAATRTGLKLTDWTVTEAGFAADLGAEKFLHIKCRELGMLPAAVVMVVTARALKMHGGVEMADIKTENLEAIEAGFANPAHHIGTLGKFGVPVVVAINRFPHDTDAELALIKKLCDDLGVRSALSEVAARGGEGGTELAKAVMEAGAEGNRPYKSLYDINDSLKTKIETVAKEVYGADGVDFEEGALADLESLEANGFGKLPVCMAKTQLSISDDPKKKGAPSGWRLSVRSAKVSNGAGFVVVTTGKILLMPGMPKSGAALNIGMDEDGNIYGLS